MKNDLNYFKFLQLKALDCIFNPTDDYLQRKICRWYSKEYSTPLNQVLEMPFDYVLTHYYESEFEKQDHNQLIDQLIEDHLPEIQQDNEDDDEEFMEMLEKEQEMGLKKKQSLTNPTVPVVKNQPSTSNPPSQPEDIVMNFDDNGFNDE